MSHFSLIVVVQPGDSHRALKSPKDYLASALEPFNENREVGPTQEFIPDEDVAEMKRHYKTDTLEDLVPHMEDWDGSPGGIHEGKLYRLCTRNPDSKWDWYEIGGRWTGFFKARDGQVGEPGVLTDPARKSHFDVVVKRDVDFASMRMDKGQKAGATWDKVQAIVQANGGMPPHWNTILSKQNGADRAWADVRKKHGCGDDVYDTLDEDLRRRLIEQARADFNAPTDAARAEYHSLPVISALRAKGLLPWFGEFREVYDVTRDEFVRRAEDSAAVPFALLINGSWNEKGRMGWFGISNDKMTQDEWNKKVWEVLLGLPDDAVLIAVGCHI